MKSSEVRKAGDRSNSTLNIMMTSILKNSLGNDTKRPKGNSYNVSKL